MNTRYLVETVDENKKKKPGAGIWAISRFLDGDWRHFVEDRPLEDPKDLDRALRAVGEPHTAATIDRYFSVRSGVYCPKLELLELLSHKHERVVGV